MKAKVGKKHFRQLQGATHRNMQIRGLSAIRQSGENILRGMQNNKRPVAQTG